MIGLDTNVLVRYIMQDYAKQSPKANHLMNPWMPITLDSYPSSA